MKPGPAVAARFEGALLVSAPTNDFLIYGDARHPAALLVMTALARKNYDEAQRGLSKQVFRWTPTGWPPAAP